MEDLRQFIEELDSHGQLERIEGFDCVHEIGGMSQIVRRDELGSALLFDDIVDHDAGFRLLTNSLDTPLQFSLAMGYGSIFDLKEVLLAHKKNSFDKEAGSLEQVTEGPILENIERDDEIDITRFPAPIWNSNDGGKYIGTGDAVITRHAETGDLNAGTYRIQVHGPQTATINIEPDRDGEVNKESYFEQGKPFPVAVSLGHLPDMFLAASERTGPQMNELEYLSARRGEPLKTISGEVTDLPIPNRSELVFEGHVYPEGERIEEGPFGEFTGYYGSGGRDQLPFRVERVYYRDNPIVFGYNNVPVKATANSKVKTAVSMWEQLEEAGIPGVDEVNARLPGSWYQVISIEQQYSGHSTQTGMQAISLPAAAWTGRLTVIVDEDIDAFDRDEVLWAMSTRFDPEEDLHVISNCVSSHLDPRIPPEQKESGDLTNSRAVIDATRPYHWQDEFPPDTKLSHERETELREQHASLLKRIGEGSED